MRMGIFVCCRDPLCGYFLFHCALCHISCSLRDPCAHKNIWPQQQYFITSSPKKTCIHWVDFTAPGTICKRSFTQLSIQFLQLVVALHASPRTLQCTIKHTGKHSAIQQSVICVYSVRWDVFSDIGVITMVLSDTQPSMFRLWLISLPV